MMEWVLRYIPTAHPYIDYVIVGSDEEKFEELIEEHKKDVWKVLKRLKKFYLWQAQ